MPLQRKPPNEDALIESLQSAAQRYADAKADQQNASLALDEVCHYAWHQHLSARKIAPIIGIASVSVMRRIHKHEARIKEDQALF